MTRTSQLKAAPAARRVRACALLALAGLAAGGAWGQALLQPGPRSDYTDADVLRWRAGVQLQRDDNVFLEPEAQARSDTLQVSTLGLQVVKPWSLQRLELDVALQDHQYDRFSALDFTALNYNGAFRWAVTPRLRGALQAERSEAIDRFSDVGGGNVNRRTERRHGLDAEYEIGAAWRALAGVYEQRSRNSAAGAEPDASVRGAELGARYALRSGNSLGWRLRQGQGDYADAATATTTGDFSDLQHEFSLDWAATGQLRVGGRLGWLERTHDLQPVRDFSGWTGRLDGTWQLTGKTRVQGGLVRELAAYQTADASYYEGWRVFLAPEWKPTVKTAVRLRLDHGQRTYKGSPVPTGTGDRQDTLNIVALGLEWEPVRALRLLATVQREQRDANRNTADYTANVVGLAAQLSF